MLLDKQSRTCSTLRNPWISRVRRNTGNRAHEEAPKRSGASFVLELTLSGFRRESSVTSVALFSAARFCCLNPIGIMPRREWPT